MPNIYEQANMSKDHHHPFNANDISYESKYLFTCLLDSLHDSLTSSPMGRSR